jgi:enamine deaminase RidA (YjgF/YER057c/UK114 family)
MVQLVERGGGSVDDIAHVWVFLKDFAHHDLMIERWLETFPHDGQRPARKTIRYDLPGDTLVQLQATAVLGGGRVNLEVPGIGHHDPIPLATRTRNILISSGVAGHSQANYQLGKDLEEQTALMFDNVRTLLELAGGGLDDVAHVTLLLRDYADRAVLDRHWRAAFPDPSNQPARYEMTLGLPGDAMRVQAHVIAVLPEVETRA